MTNTETVWIVVRRAGVSLCGRQDSYAPYEMDRATAERTVYPLFASREEAELAAAFKAMGELL